MSKVGEWEDAPQTNQTSEWEDVPHETQKHSLSSKVLAFTGGLASGVLGEPGDVVEGVKSAGTGEGKSNLRKTFETFATLPAKAIVGNATLPTTKGIQNATTSALNKSGHPSFFIEHPGYTTAGEIAPAIVGGVTGAYKLGKKLPQILGLDYFGLKNEAKGANEVLRSALESKAGKESKLAKTKSEQAKTTAETAETTAEKAKRQTETTKRDLPGFETQQEAGRYKPIGQTVADIGDRLKKSADQVYSTLKARRDANAQKLKGEAFSDALNKEKAGARVTDTQAFKDAKDLISKSLVNPDTKLANTSVGEIKEQLLKVRRSLDPREVDPATGLVTGRPPSFESLDQLRRFLRDRANGLPAQGYDAISQQQAGKLASAVEKIMTEFSPGFEKFIAQYAADSQPMRVFQTRAGKSMIDEQLFGKGANYATTSSESVANNVFKNKENFGALVDALGGNKQLAQAEARRYFGSQLEGKASAKEVETFIRQNREMLRETGSLKDAESYAINLRKFENRATAAEEIAKTNKLSQTQKLSLSNEMSTFESQLAQATPEQLPIVARNFANNLIKQGLIDQKGYQNMLNEINQLKNMAGDVQAAKKRLKTTLYTATVGIVGYKGYHIGQEVLGI